MEHLAGVRDGSTGEMQAGYRLCDITAAEVNGSERFVIRSTGQRFVINRRNRKSSVAELGAKCRLRHRARIIKI